MLKKSSISWNARQISKMIDKGTITFDSIIQRNLVWNNEQKSLLIHSMIEDYIIYPMVARKIGKTYSVTDGKQRLLGSVNAYLNNKFALVNVPEVELDDGTLMDINGMFFEELPEEVQDAINSFMFTIYYYEEISDDQEADVFFRINNGSKLTNIEISRIRCRALETINAIGKHELFTTALTEKAFEKYTHEDLVIKSYIMLTSNNPSLDTKFVRPLMEKVGFTNDDIELMNKVYDRILNTYKTIIADDSTETGKISKRIAKRLFTRTHMLSIMPIVKRSLEENVSDEMFTNWVKNFFCGTKSVTKYNEYNTRCASGSGHAENVKVRLKVIKKDYEKFMKENSKENKTVETVESAETVEIINNVENPIITTEPIAVDENIEVVGETENESETDESTDTTETVTAA